MLEYASDHLKPILVVALATGMRLGETLILQWDQVDFNLKTITVRHAKNTEFRKIPMNDRLTKRWIKLSATGTLKIIYSYKSITRGPGLDGRAPSRSRNDF
jgi:integrase